MKRQTFLIVAAAVALVFGLAFVLIPGPLMTLYGIALGDAGQWVGRYFGSALIGVAAINWFVRKSAGSETLRGVVLGGLVLTVIGAIVSVLDAIFGPGSAVIWVNVVIYGLLTVGYAFYLPGSRST